MSKAVAFAAVLASASAGVALAHHSRAAYDMTREVVFEGTVVDLHWRNPHIFMTLEIPGADGEGALQEIEVTSVSEALALGIPREAISPGAQVVVRAHPNRRAESARAVGLDVRTSDGEVYPLNTDARLSVGPAQAVPADGLAGIWVATVDSFNGLTAAALSWPYTEAGAMAGQEAATKFNDPAIAVLGICEPFPPPLLSVFPEPRMIEVNGTTVVMRFEGGIGLMMERVVHMDQAEHPAGVAPSLMGHSIGRWEGDSLVIDTVAFAPHYLGVFFVPSGPEKRLIERLTPSADRLSLDYTMTVEDPSVLGVPVSYTAKWDHRPDLRLSGEACDPETARRALEE